MCSFNEVNRGVPTIIEFVSAYISKLKSLFHQDAGETCMWPFHDRLVDVLQVLSDTLITEPASNWVDIPKPF